MRRDELDIARPSGLDRPNERWMCGHSGEGSTSKCSFGPNQRGRCPLAEACRPRRTWAGRKKQVAFLSSLLLVAIVVAMAWLSEPASVIKPGDLSSAHAQILESTLETQRCASCHVDVNEPGTFSLTQVASHVIGMGDNARSQSQLCMDCHHVTIDRDTAMKAHNLPINQRDQLRLASATSGTSDRSTSWHDALPSPAVDQENIQCSACHREHHGAEHDLRRLSDAQCQTCHQDRFGDFASSHPSFGDWPYGRGGNIGFDHRTHMTKHYPASSGAGESSGMTFDCSKCHTVDALGQVARTVSYEAACASCHDDGLRLEVSEGLELLALPTIPESAAKSIANWPEAATGFFDGNVSPLTRLLLRGADDKATTKAINRLADDGFARLNPNNDGDIEFAATVAGSLRELMERISFDGQTAIVDRLVASGIKQETANHLAQSFSPQLVDGAIERWFGERSAFAQRRQQASVFRAVQFQKPGDDELLEQDDLLAGDDLLVGNDLLGGDDPLGGDALLGDDLLGDDLLGDDLLGDDDLLGGDPLAVQDTSEPKSKKRFDADRMLKSGGWYRDDTRLAIRYRGSGHADPSLVAVIEAAAQLGGLDKFNVQMLEHKAVKACLQCHAGAASYAGLWKSEPLVGSRSQFTKFSHTPHLNIASLSDCKACHQVQSGLDVSTISSESIAEFVPIEQQDCAACHHKNAASDSCVDCHRYHISP
ncbi:Doubled CXXCH motif [Rubripirellula amarantea]|uniref:Doubled CXXCH motif n=1 Tax=Rubripirellula amarantea TaxID=2527999 RepID=A0A5C5WW61_9BACT|nr:cytochrome c3 family protein [Rubripirellula amarantea]TWT54381.1 Doubled CXXCH motif [Rubripirellula amarantea]